MACRTDRISSNRLPKTRPSSSRIIFCVRTEQRVAASRAKVNSLFVRVPVSVGERQFRSPSSKYVILATRQDVFPFIVRELYFLVSRNILELGPDSCSFCLTRLFCVLSKYIQKRGHQMPSKYAINQ